jgi:hypothetical protein
MFSSVRRHLSYANVAATMALVFAMSGGALAASHYLVNSTKQINPKVLKKLKGNAGAKGAKGVAGPAGPAGPQGKDGSAGASGTTVVDRARSVGPTESTNKVQFYPLSSATWSQGANEAELLVGNVKVTAPPESKCNYNKKLYGGHVEVEILIDGAYAASEYIYAEAAEQKAVVKPIYTESSLVDSGAVVAHTMTAKITDNCGASEGTAERHFTIEAVNVDVLGAH